MTLAWSQGQAAEAIRLWNEGQAATNNARAEHAKEIEQAQQQIRPGAPPVDIPFHDPGEAKRQAARDMLGRARQQLALEGETAADIVSVARNQAPEEQSWVAQALDAAGDAAATVVNAVASLGNAVIQHPELVGTLALGGVVTAASAVGVAGGVTVSASGVGAVGGGPLTYVAGAGVVAGAGMVVASVGGLASEAAGDDAVEVIDTNDAVAAEDGPFTPEHVDTVDQHFSRLDHAPQNDAMINQVREAMEEGRPLSEAEENFMKHETTEAKLMDDGMPYDDAHEIALEQHPLFKNYSPEVIEKYPEYFNNRWREAWGMPPR